MIRSPQDPTVYNYNKRARHCKRNDHKHQAAPPEI